MNRSRSSPLDHPDNAAHAWRRYKGLMIWMGFFTLAVLAIALGALYEMGALVSIHFVIATVLGIGFAMMLMAALLIADEHHDAVQKLAAGRQAVAGSAQEQKSLNRRAEQAESNAADILESAATRLEAIAARLAHA